MAHRTDIETVQRQGKRWRTGVFETRAVASPRAFGRVGLIVPKYRHGSVERNRLKRRMREIVRVELLPALAPVDVVVRALPHAYARDFGALRAEVQRIAEMLMRWDAGPRTAHSPKPTAGLADTN